MALPMSGCATAGQTGKSEKPAVPLAPPGSEERHQFSKWVADFRSEAVKQGISRDLYDRATRNIEFDESVVKADRSQPEFTKPVWEYLKSAVSDKRIAKGRELLRQHAELLGRIEQAYGVDRHVVVAIWGCESNFGEVMGSRNVIQSLATLGFEGRRPEYGRSQLIAALRILQAGDIRPELMTGSWAGAMGQTQFIPTTYLAHAVDFDKDGRRDIWRSTGDALASTAHYLSVSGWKTGAVWGREIILPAGFDYASAEMGVKRPVSAWQSAGVKRVDGSQFPAGESGTNAAVFLPAGHKGPVFLVYDNFQALLAYNASTSYAMAVSLLADRFRGRGDIVKPWPLDERPLSRSERMELQERLNAKGYEVGKPDAVIGYQTRKAIRQFQTAKGLPADGFATSSLLQKLRGN